MAGGVKNSSRHFFYPPFNLPEKIILAIIEAISKLLKIVKAPSLRSDKGSVFPPSHKATAGQAAVTLQVASANYPLQLFANGIFVIF